MAGLVGEHLLVKGGAVFWFVETDLVDVYPALVEEAFDFHSHISHHGHLCECENMCVWVCKYRRGGRVSGTQTISCSCIVGSHRPGQRSSDSRLTTRLTFPDFFTVEVGLKKKYSIPAIVRDMKTIELLTSQLLH